MTGPRLWELKQRLQAWKLRLVVDAVVLLVTLVLLEWNGAPAWAAVLAVYVATRSARLDNAAEAGAIQSTYRVRLEAIEKSVDVLTERIDRTMHPNARARRTHAPPAD